MPVIHIVAVHVQDYVTITVPQHVQVAALRNAPLVARCVVVCVLQVVWVAQNLAVNLVVKHVVIRVKLLLLDVWVVHLDVLDVLDVRPHVMVRALEHASRHAVDVWQDALVHLDIMTPAVHAHRNVLRHAVVKSCLKQVPQTIIR